jgi:hypothetical protein
LAKANEGPYRVRHFILDSAAFAATKIWSKGGGCVAAHGKEGRIRTSTTKKRLSPGVKMQRKWDLKKRNRAYRYRTCGGCRAEDINLKIGTSRGILLRNRLWEPIQQGLRMLKVEDTAEPSHTRGVNGLGGEVQGTRTGALRLPFRENRPERFALRRKLLEDWLLR